MKRSLVIVVVFLIGMLAQLHAQTVYVTAEGKKYHKQDCRYVKSAKNVTSMSLADATSKGYSPCDVCFGAAAGKTVKAAGETKTAVKKAADDTKTAVKASAASAKKQAADTKKTAVKKTDKVKADVKDKKKKVEQEVTK
jgi:hypothetical protein